MKILCDVCDKREATVLCVADEAALCAACDHAVHHANKLAGKHQRFALRPSADCSLCDICKEKKALMFCQEDRAILCRGCDFQIHRANELTRKHARFLLTGVQLSPAPEKPDPVSTPKRAAPGRSEEISTSSVSEYFTETLPGWRVDEFLDYSPNQTQGSKVDLPPMWDSEIYRNSRVAPAESSGFWVLELSVPAHKSQSLEALVTSGFKGNRNTKSNRKISENNSFAVPEISFQSRRTFW